MCVQQYLLQVGPISTLKITLPDISYFLKRVPEKSRKTFLFSPFLRNNAVCASLAAKCTLAVPRSAPSKMAALLTDTCTDDNFPPHGSMLNAKPRLAQTPEVGGQLAGIFAYRTIESLEDDGE